MRFAHPFFLVLAALVPLAGLFWSFLRARRTKALVPVPAMTTMPSCAPTPAYSPFSASLPLSMAFTLGKSSVRIR